MKNLKEYNEFVNENLFTKKEIDDNIGLDILNNINDNTIINSEESNVYTFKYKNDNIYVQHYLTSDKFNTILKNTEPLKLNRDLGEKIYIKCKNIYNKKRGL